MSAKSVPLSISRRSTPLTLPSPTHPALVTYPLALLSSAYALDLLTPILPHLPFALSDRLPAQSDLAFLSYYLLSAGLLLGLPAVASGVLQAGHVGKAGIHEADGKTVKKKVTTMWIHAATMDLGLIAGTAYWWVRRRAGAEQVVIDGWMVGVSGVLGALLLFAGGLGRKLVFSHGMGLGGARNKVD